LATFLEGLNFHDLNVKGRSFPSSALLIEYFEGGDVQLRFLEGRDRSIKVIRPREPHVNFTQFITDRLNLINITDVVSECSKPIDQSALTWYSGDRLLEILLKTYNLKDPVYNRGLSNWEIAGIVIGGIVVLALIAYAIYHYRSKRIRKQLDDESAGPRQYAGF